MKNLFFKCSFLSDIILKQTSATEGVSPSLDHIPGVKFLGIAAKNYNDFKENAFQVFHSGKIRFGNAYPLLNNQRALPVPLCWHHEKGSEYYNSDRQLQSKSIYNLLDNNNQFEKLIQIHSGFFNSNGDYYLPEEDFSLKSAWDPDKRRSKDSQMFGYNALRKGSDWIFTIDFDDDIEDSLIEKVKTGIIGRQSIGRSRSAQYGRVLIEECLEEKPQERILVNNKLYIYAQSPLAFLDGYGEPTLRPCESSFLLKDRAVIDWANSFVRTRVYSPWNGKQQRRERERVCIEKGSIFTFDLTGSENFSINDYYTKTASGIGLYRNEGMGRIIVNPPFLYNSNGDMTIHPSFHSKARSLLSGAQPKPLEETPQSKEEEKIIRWIESRIERNNYVTIINSKVFSIVHDYHNNFHPISASQWGAIRKIVEECPNIDRIHNRLFQRGTTNERNKGFLVSGVNYKSWNDSDRAEKLWKIVTQKEIPKKWQKDFLILLCTEFAKNRQKEKVGGSKI